MKIKVDLTQFNQLMQEVELAPRDIVDDAYIFFKDQTPIDRGNARRNTRKTKTTIVGDYPYAARLDEGWSKQAPKGMTEPTVEYIEKDLIPKITGRLNRG